MLLLVLHDCKATIKLINFLFLLCGPGFTRDTVGLKTLVEEQASAQSCPTHHR